MSAITHQSTDTYVEHSVAFLDRLLKEVPQKFFSFRFWDGTEWQPDPSQPIRFTIVLNHPGALRKMFLNLGQLSLGEDYIYEDFDIEGDLDSVFELYDSLVDLKFSWLDYIRHALTLMRLPNERDYQNDQAAYLTGREHSEDRDRQAVTYHYNVSNDFYRLWLDDNMVYSCAYFESPDEDIDTVQFRKLDYICRKLRLKPGERLLDIGCGWGGLIIHAAKHYGVEAVGITLSQPQADLANERIRESGLQDRCRAEVRDYRDIGAQTFDKVVSVGMVEHVGRKNLRPYFEQAYYVLKPGGVFMCHGIGSAYHEEKFDAPFIQKYVFPDGELVPITDYITFAEQAQFEVRDVENLREHYALTLKHWVDRLRANKGKALNLVSRVTYRVWEIYMAASRYTFRAGINHLYQLVLYKPDDTYETKLPLTRKDWYQTDGV